METPGRLGWSCIRYLHPQHGSVCQVAQRTVRLTESSVWRVWSADPGFRPTVSEQMLKDRLMTASVSTVAEFERVIGSPGKAKPNQTVSFFI